VVCEKTISGFVDAFSFPNRGFGNERRNGNLQGFENLEGIFKKCFDENY